MNQSRRIGAWLRREPFPPGLGLRLACKATKLYCAAAALLLVVSALLKLGSPLLYSTSASRPDPVLPFLSRFELGVVTVGIEIAVAFLTIRSIAALKPPIALLLLACCFGWYHVSLSLLGLSGSCACLGSVFHVLPQSPAIERRIMLGLVLFLLIPSAGLCAFHLWSDQAGRLPGISADNKQS